MKQKGEFQPVLLAIFIALCFLREDRKSECLLSLLGGPSSAAQLEGCGSGAAPASVCQVLRANARSEGDYVTPSKDELTVLPPCLTDSTTQETRAYKVAAAAGRPVRCRPSSAAERAESPARTLRTRCSALGPQPGLSPRHCCSRAR